MKLPNLYEIFFWVEQLLDDDDLVEKSDGFEVKDEVKRGIFDRQEAAQEGKQDKRIGNSYVSSKSKSKVGQNQD